MPINTFNDAATTTISGSLVVAKDPRTGDAGNLTVASGFTLTAGNEVITAGNLTLTSGNVTLTTGNIVQTAGNLTLTTGNATLTSGNLVLTAGNETLTTGNLTLTAGSMIVTNGNISLTTGVIGGGVIVQTIATSPANTIAVTGRSARITGAGIATCALASGTVDGQDLTIFNAGAASTVVSTAGYAYANITLASLACQSFYWDATNTLWYHKA